MSEDIFLCIVLALAIAAAIVQQAYYFYQDFIEKGTNAPDNSDDE